MMKKFNLSESARPKASKRIATRNVKLSGTLQFSGKTLVESRICSEGFHFQRQAYLHIFTHVH